MVANIGHDLLRNRECYLELGIDMPGRIQRPATLARNALDVQKLALRAHFDTEDVNIALGASENTTALKNTEMAHRCPSGPDASFPATRMPADCMGSMVKPYADVPNLWRGESELIGDDGQWEAMACREVNCCCFKPSTRLGARVMLPQSGRSSVVCFGSHYLRKTHPNPWKRFR